MFYLLAEDSIRRQISMRFVPINPSSPFYYPGFPQMSIPQIVNDSFILHAKYELMTSVLIRTRSGVHDSVIDRATYFPDVCGNLRKLSLSITMKPSTLSASTCRDC